MKKFFTDLKKKNNETGVKWGYNTINFSVNWSNFIFIPCGINIARDFTVIQSAWILFSFNYMYSKHQKSIFHGYFFNRKTNYFNILFDKNTFLLKKVAE